jgi:hypothetical protein
MLKRIASTGINLVVLAVSAGIFLAAFIAFCFKIGYRFFGLQQLGIVLYLSTELQDCYIVQFQFHCQYVGWLTFQDTLDQQNCLLWTQLPLFKYRPFLYKDCRCSCILYNDTLSTHFYV